MYSQQCSSGTSNDGTSERTLSASGPSEWTARGGESTSLLPWASGPIDRIGHGRTCPPIPGRRRQECSAGVALTTCCPTSIQLPPATVASATSAVNVAEEPVCQCLEGHLSSAVVSGTAPTFSCARRFVSLCLLGATGCELTCCMSEPFLATLCIHEPSGPSAMTSRPAPKAPLPHDVSRVAGHIPVMMAVSSDRNDQVTLFSTLMPCPLATSQVLPLCPPTGRRPKSAWACLPASAPAPAHRASGSLQAAAARWSPSTSCVVSAWACGGKDGTCAAKRARSSIACCRSRNASGPNKLLLLQSLSSQMRSNSCGVDCVCGSVCVDAEGNAKVGDILVSVSWLSARPGVSPSAAGAVEGTVAVRGRAPTTHCATTCVSTASKPGGGDGGHPMSGVNAGAARKGVATIGCAGGAVSRSLR